MSLRYSALSAPFLRYGTFATVNGVPINPTADVVSFAFKATGVDPTGPDWKVGSWETVAGPPIVYVARIQIGPGSGNVLTKGTYIVWVKVADSPETIVVPVGQLEIF